MLVLTLIDSVKLTGIITLFRYDSSLVLSVLWPMLKYKRKKKINLKIRTVFTVRVEEHQQKRVPGETVESPFSEVFKT